MRHFFTVAVPTYNSALYIRQNLNGILSQTFRDFCLLILDDGSTDNTVEIVQSFLPELNKKGIAVQLIQNDGNIGGYANFNRCIDLAEGTYLFIHHADDVMKPEMLETLHERIVTLGDFSILHVNSNAISQDGEIEDHPYFQWTKKDRIFFEQNGHPFLKLFLSNLGWSVAQTVYRTDFLQSADIRFKTYFDKHDSGQDYLFFIDLVEKADRILHIQKPLMYRRMAETQWAKRSMSNIDYVSLLIQETLIPMAEKVQTMPCAFSKKRYFRKLFYNKLLHFFKRNPQKRLEALQKCRNIPLLNIAFPRFVNLGLSIEWRIQLNKRRSQRLFARIQKQFK